MAGGVGAYFLFGEEGSSRSKKRDDDDDDERPRKKRSQAVPDKAADCRQLKTFMGRFEVVSAATNPDPPIDEQFAELASDLKETELTTPEGRAIASRMATSFSDLAGAVERGLAASNRNDAVTAAREAQNVQNIGETLSATMLDLGLLCGWGEESP